MKKGGELLRTAKQAFLNVHGPVPLKERERPHQSLLGCLDRSSRRIFCAEIHNSAQYNGSGFNRSLEELVRLYDKHADAIVLATDEVIFNGSREWIARASVLTQKPIVILDLFLTKEQIHQAHALGADVVLLIVSLLEEHELHSLYAYSVSIGLEVIIEVQDESELEMAMRCQPRMIGINTRDINNLAIVDMGKVPHLSSLVSSDVHLIAESGIKTNYDIKRYCRSSSGVIVGSSILESRNVEGSLQYFAFPDKEPPFVWVRPPAFLFPERLQFIISTLRESGFEIGHSFKVQNTPQVYAKMYEPKFRKNPIEGKLFYSVMQEGLNQVALRGGNPEYSEVWMLKSQESNLIEALKLLLGVKEYTREKEGVPVTTTLTEGVEMPVLLHSIHSPDPTWFDYQHDFAVLSRFREHRNTLLDFS